MKSVGRDRRRRECFALVVSLASLPACGSEGEADARPPYKPKLDASADATGDALSSKDGSFSDAPGGGSDAQGCVPRTCAQLGAQCGSAADGCGGVIQCGSCPTGQNCGGGGANKCGTGACTPKTCAQLGASCGVASDGCGDVVSCGSCVPPQTCGGAGTANQCGCTPKTCPELGAECGSISDGCNNTLACGGCVAPSICGGAGGANKCSCSPTSCAAQGVHCGNIPNGCGDTLDCGGCGGTQSCINGNCGCAGGTHLCGSSCINDASCCSDGDCAGMNVCPSPGAACACRTSPARQAIYRSYLYATDDHFFSPWQAEGPNAGYQDEGVRFYDYAGPCQWGLVTFYRVLNPNSGEHFYTANPAEKDGLVATGWHLEGEIGCIAPSAICGAVPLYRLSTTTSRHMFTADAAERDALVAGGAAYEGPAGYVWTSP